MNTCIERFSLVCFNARCLIDKCLLRQPPTQSLLSLSSKIASSEASSSRSESPISSFIAQAREGEGLLTSSRKHRTAALQAAEVIAFQAEQSELEDLIDEEGDLEPVRGPFDPLTSQVAKGPRTIRKRNPEGPAGESPHSGMRQ